MAWNKSWQRPHEALRIALERNGKGLSGCIQWVGNIHQNGFGRYYNQTRGKSIRAHRLLWERINGPIPEEALVLHECGNRACVNVSHMVLGDVQDQVDAMWKRGTAKPHGKPTGVLPE